MTPKPDTVKDKPEHGKLVETKAQPERIDVQRERVNGTAYFE